MADKSSSSSSSSSSQSLSLSTSGNFSKKSFFSAINDLEKPQANKSDALDYICKAVEGRKVVTKTKHVELLRPLVEYGFKTKDDTERMKVFIALKAIFWEVSPTKMEVERSDTCSVKDANDLIDMAKQYTWDNNNEGGDITMAVSILIFGCAMKYGADPKKIQVRSVKVLTKDYYTRSALLFLVGASINRYYADYEEYRARSREDEKRKVLQRSTSSSGMLSSSQPDTAPDQQGTPQKELKKPHINDYFLSEEDDGGSFVQDADANSNDNDKVAGGGKVKKGIISTNNSTKEEEEETEADKFIRGVAENNVDMLKKPTKFTIFFYERYIIHALRKNIKVNNSTIVKPTMDASIGILDQEKFAVKFLVEYIAYNKEGPRAQEKYKKELKHLIKHAKGLDILSEFSSFYSKNLYMPTLKAFDECVILATELMRADCTNVALQEQSFGLLESIPGNVGYMRRIGTENVVNFIVGTMKAYSGNPIIYQKGVSILYKLFSLQDEKVDKALHRKDTYSVLVEGGPVDHDPTNVFIYIILQMILKSEKRDFVLRDVRDKCAKIEHDIENPKLLRYVFPVVISSDLTMQMFPKIRKFFLSDNLQQKVISSNYSLLLSVFNRCEPTAEIFEFAKTAVNNSGGNEDVEALGCAVIGNNITEGNFSDGFGIVVRLIEKNRSPTGSNGVISAGYKAILAMSMKLEGKIDVIQEIIKHPTEMEFTPVDENDWRHPPSELLSDYVIADFYFKLLSECAKCTVRSSRNVKLILEVIKKDDCAGWARVNGLKALVKVFSLFDLRKEDEDTLEDAFGTVMLIVNENKDYSVKENILAQVECCNFFTKYVKSYGNDNNTSLIYTTITNLKKKRNPEMNKYYDQVSKFLEKYNVNLKNLKKENNVMLRGLIIEEYDGENSEGEVDAKPSSEPDTEPDVDDCSSSSASDLNSAIMLKLRPKDSGWGDMDEYLESKEKGRPDIESVFQDMSDADMTKTLEEALKEAGFIEIQSMLEFSKEIAESLKKKGFLKRDDGDDMTLSEAMAITIYTYDNGPDLFENNPFRIINKALTDHDPYMLRKLRVYLLYLLKGLRKLTPFNSTGKKLYRCICRPKGRTYTEKEKILWQAFTSTSMDEDAALDFSSSFIDKGAVLFEINGEPVGYAIREFSFHPDEDEILLELGTKVKITKISQSANNQKLDKVTVNAYKPDKLLLADVVDRFKGKCIYNVVKTTPPSPPEIKGITPIPISMYDEDKAITALKTLGERYRPLKACLNKIILLEPVKTMLKSLKETIDDCAFDDINLIKFYQLTQEESCAVYASTFRTKNGDTEICPTDFINDALLKQSDTIDINKLLYLMHVLNGLRKIFDCSSNDNTFYICIPKGWTPEDNAEYVIPGFSIAYMDKEEALKVVRAPSGEYGSVISISGENLKIYKVSALSNKLKDFKVIVEPNFRFRVDSTANKEVISVVPVQGENKLGTALSEQLETFRKAIPLPHGWTIGKDESTGQLYYLNEETCQTQWARPDMEDPDYYENVTWRKSMKPTTANPALLVGSRNSVNTCNIKINNCPPKINLGPVQPAPKIVIPDAPVNVPDEKPMGYGINIAVSIPPPIMSSSFISNASDEIPLGCGANTAVSIPPPIMNSSIISNASDEIPLGCGANAAVNVPPPMMNPSGPSSSSDEIPMGCGTSISYPTNYQAPPVRRRPNQPTSQCAPLTMTSPCPITRYGNINASSNNNNFQQGNAFTRTINYPHQ